MVITAEILITLLAIGGPLFAGAFALWGRIEKKFKEHDEALAERVKAVKLETEKTQGRLEILEKNTVQKDAYLLDRQTTDRAIESIALSFREGIATVTGRIDLVLFEINRRNHNDGNQ